MKFTDEQKELLALLPKDLKNSQELTDSAKLVLSNIIFLYGMEDAQKNGYVYRSYDDLMKDTFIKSKTSISKAIALLIQKEYIKVKSGRLKDRKANEFTLLDNTLLNKKCTEKCTDKCTDIDYCSKKCSNEIETLQNEVLLLQKQMVLLQKEIEELKKCTEKCTDKNEKCTEKCTTESDTETDKDNNITTGILEHKDLVPKVTEDKENKKEKVNEMKNAVLNEMERKDNETLTSTSGERNTNFNYKEPVYGNLTDELFDEIFGLSSTEDNDTIDVNVTGDKVKPSSIETSNKAAGDVETRSMEQLPTNEDKNAPEDLKTQNNAYTLQEWMTEYQKLILQVENTDVEAVQFDTLLDEGVKLIEAFPQNEGNYQRAMQDLRYWVVRKVDFKKSFKISERWNKYYRAA